jgi:hypothetical protein
MANLKFFSWPFTSDYNRMGNVTTSERMDGRMGSRSTQEPVDRASSTAFSKNHIQQAVFNTYGIHLVPVPDKEML